MSQETGKLEPALEIGQEIDLIGYLELPYIVLMGERNDVGWAQVSLRPVAFHVYDSEEYEEACELHLRLDYITEFGPNRMQHFSQDASQVIILDNNLRALTGFGDQVHRIRVRGVVCDEWAASELGRMLCALRSSNSSQSGPGRAGVVLPRKYLLWCCSIIWEKAAQPAAAPDRAERAACEVG